METYLLGTTDHLGRTIYAAYVFATSSEARRRAYLRLSTPGMTQVAIWKMDGADWKFIDVFVIPDYHCDCDRSKVGDGIHSDACSTRRKD